MHLLESMEMEKQRFSRSSRPHMNQIKMFFQRNSTPAYSKVSDKHRVSNALQTFRSVKKKHILRAHRRCCPMIAGHSEVPRTDPRTASRRQWADAQKKLVKHKQTRTLTRSEATQSRVSKNTQHTRGWDLHWTVYISQKTIRSLQKIVAVTQIKRLCKAHI